MSHLYRPYRSFRSKKRRALHVASAIGAGGMLVGALAGCSTSSTPAPSAAAATLAPTATSQPPAATAAQTVPAETMVPAATPTATAVPTTVPPTATPAMIGQYRDGEYVGDAVPADRWGDMQVRAVIQGGQLVQIDILTYPSSTRRSDLISRANLPTLISEAIENQDADVDIVTRATDTSVAFIASLESALQAAAVDNASI